MSRSKRFLNGIVVGYVYQAVVMVVGLWLTPFLLHRLGQHDFGLWLTALQVMTYLGLADFGVIAILPRTIAYATGRGSAGLEDVANALSRTAVIVLAQTPLVGIAAALIWIFLPHEWLALRGPIGVIMASFVLLFPLRILPAALEGLQEQAFGIRANMAGWTVGIVCNVLLILAGARLYSVAAGWFVSQSVMTALCAYRLWTHHRHLLPNGLPKFSRAELFSQMGRGSWVSINQLGQVLMASTDVLVISKVLGPSLVVPYVCTAKLASVLANQPQMLMHLATPGLSQMRTGAPKERTYSVTVALSQGMLLLTGLLLCVILSVNEGFVRWWVGYKQFGGLTLTCLILVNMVLHHGSLTFAYTSFSFGYERRLAIAGFLDGLVTVSAMSLLVSRFGYEGVVIGSIIGVCVTSMPITMYTVAHELNLPLSSLLRPFWPWFWRFSTLASACVALAMTWVPRTPIQMIAIGGAVTLAYCALLWHPILRSPLGPYLVQGFRDLQRIVLKPFVPAPDVEKAGLS